MEEKVVTDPREADVGSILGFGFAPFTGGTLSYIDGMGVARFVALARSLAAKHGDRFTPNALLIEMAKNGETFYGRFGEKGEGGGLTADRERPARSRRECGRAGRDPAGDRAMSNSSQAVRRRASLSRKPSRPESPMSRRIDYYFSLLSPWAYIGHRFFLDIARRHNVSIVYKPVLLNEVFSQTGGLPLAKRHPARQAYRTMELQRWREKRLSNFICGQNIGPTKPTSPIARRWQSSRRAAIPPLSSQAYQWRLGEGGQSRRSRGARASVGRCRIRF